MENCASKISQTMQRLPNNKRENDAKRKGKKKDQHQRAA